MLLTRILPYRGLFYRSLHRPRLILVGTSRTPVVRFRLQSSQPRQDPSKNAFQKAHHYIRDNPYTKFSLTICAIVLGLSVVVELFKRFKKKKSPAVAIFPPKVCHVTIQRSSLLDEIDGLIKQIKKQKEEFPVLYLTGQPGVGKSELVHQYVTRFANNCTKWFGLRPVSPVILFVNGTSIATLESSLREAAFGLGIQDKDLQLDPSSASSFETLAILSAAIRSKLLETNLPWLIVVDNLSKEAIPGYKVAFLSQSNTKAHTKQDASSESKGQVSWKDIDGAVVTVTSGEEGKSLPVDHCVSIPSRLGIDDGLKLFRGLMDISVKEEEAVQLLESLQCHPMAIALAASTIRIYQSFIESQPELGESNVISTYQDLLKQDSPSGDILNMVMSLYLEAAVTDERFRHAFDLLGSCDLSLPLPVSVIFRHLDSSFYRISKESLAPPPIDAAIQMQKLTGINPDDRTSYFAQIKAMVPFLGAKAPSTSEIAAVLATSEDGVSYLRECPLLSFKSYRNSGFEYVQVHQSSHNELRRLFTKYTIPKLDMDGLASEQAQFNHSAWFRKYRSFDSQQALEKFHRSLPGISQSGVLTRDKFEKQSPLSDSSIDIGTASIRENGVDYLEYQHLVSHYHRVVETLSDEVKCADNDVGDTLTRRYLYPHIKHASQYPLLAETDNVLCSHSLVSIESALLKSNYQDSLRNFESVLSKQKQLFGERNQTVARTLVDMANLNYSYDHLSEARNLLEASLSIYESTSSKQATKSFPLEIGLAYSSLAIVCSSLGEKQRSKELLEQALGAYQTLSPEGVVSKRQRKLVSSCLTDVAHAHLSLGDLLMAKKYIDLSVMAHKNLYLDGHPETIRTLNVSSIVYALLGDKPESQKIRGEAGKLKAQVDSRPLVA